MPPKDPDSVTLTIGLCDLDGVSAKGYGWSLYCIRQAVAWLDRGGPRAEEQATGVRSARLGSSQERAILE